jgi:hypothetical protein
MALFHEFSAKPVSGETPWNPPEVRKSEIIETPPATGHVLKTNIKQAAGK